MKTVSIMIPAYNEEESIEYLYKSLVEVFQDRTNYNWEVLFINDGSTDRTLSVIDNIRSKDSRINYVDLSRNYGKEIAMAAGFDHVSGDCAIIMDSDMQHPPSIIPEMLKYWEEGFDDVYATRNMRKEEKFLKRFFSKTFYKILKKLAGIPIQMNAGDFRLLDRSCINALREIRETQRYTKGLYSWIGYNKKEILFEANERISGETKWNFWKLTELAIQGITSFTVLPLRISSIFGMIISLFSFIYFLWIVIKALAIGDPVPGYPSMMAIILFLGGVQLLSIGILGEYLGKIFKETKNRPMYFIKTMNGKKIEDK